MFVPAGSGTSIQILRIGIVALFAALRNTVAADCERRIAAHGVAFEWHSIVGSIVTEFDAAVLVPDICIAARCSFAAAAPEHIWTGIVIVLIRVIALLALFRDAVSADCRGNVTAGCVTHERRSVPCAIVAGFAAAVRIPEECVATRGKLAASAHAIGAAVIIIPVAIVAVFALLDDGVAALGRGDAGACGITLIWAAILRSVVAGFRTAVRIPHMSVAAARAQAGAVRSIGTAVRIDVVAIVAVFPCLNRCIAAD